MRRLGVLTEVADRGSFSAAAAALGMTQSAVSQHISALERAMGESVVDRASRPVQLTEAGVILVRHARAVVARLDVAEQELAAAAGRRRGRLRLGAFPTALATFLPPVLARFKRQYPTVRLTVVDDHVPRLHTRLSEASSTSPSSTTTQPFPISLRRTSNVCTSSTTPTAPCCRAGTT